MFFLCPDFYRCKAKLMYSDFQKKLGARIKKLREIKGLSQQELASICDFEKSNMSRIEAGRTNPTISTLLRISHALSVDLAEIVRIENDA
jgi:transcriptional regulator with XRE-family HTH domain